MKTITFSDISVKFIKLTLNLDFSWQKLVTKYH
jgi:hypothetical protein